MSLEISADIKNLERVSDFISAAMEHLDGTQNAEDDLFAVRLSVHEVCVNIIQHAYQGTPGMIKISATLNLDNKRLQIDLFDNGAPARLEHVIPPNLDEPQIKGYGLFLIRHLMDSVDYFRETDANHWRLVKGF